MISQTPPVTDAEHDAKASTLVPPDAGATTGPGPAPQEFGGRKGPEPTRFGDWEKDGRCIDF